MTYSKYFYPQDPKIPTPITIAIIILLIIFISRLFTTSPLPSRASKKGVKGLSIVNPSNNQVGIFWQTDAEESGWVIYGKNERTLNEIASDERDVQNKKKLYFNHFALLRNLKPDTQYFYKIVSNNQVIEAKNSTPFFFKTPTIQTSVLNLNPAYGKVIKENGQPLENAFVFILLDKAFPLITLSKTTGEWLIPLNLILNKETLKNETVNPEDKLTIEIIASDRKKSKIASDISTVSPLPQTVIIGKDYDFLNKEDILSVFSDNKTKTTQIEILFPKDSGVIPGNKPIIKGTAIPGNEVEVIIESVKNYSFKTKADRGGIWSVIVTEGLPAGSNRLLIRTKDTSGKNVQLTRTFSIAKSGEQVLAAATPEATFIPTEVPTIDLSPTLFYTPYASQSPIVSESPPTSGINFIPFSVASASLIILGLGILLAF
ncbi:hypothetical protein A2954_07680 [Candidatus Roizmanbacteria bacterium RIFCSPLOWO2_01_FULL_37_12]|uniref:Purple acid phosphatase N-terminal domain-containing protein n=1 Tax=Candidatus Roizmanbacteria bacterium RIFCSPLOWO2_01_FULL_37_12 TaxID=1802056 RepID=A0A1F7I851_9BACT|nr:MAG: hypothetical protein A2954_07680 [Candidatus Roizmanbacteria bacterium RIFCSPLOWO2_01_FULL_37_12]